MRRDRVIESINKLPNEFDPETVIERLIFIDKVEKGLKQAEEEKTIPHNEIKKRIFKWSE